MMGRDFATEYGNVVRVGHFRSLDGGSFVTDNFSRWMEIIQMFIHLEFKHEEREHT